MTILGASALLRNLIQYRAYIATIHAPAGVDSSPPEEILIPKMSKEPIKSNIAGQNYNVEDVPLNY